MIKNVLIDRRCSSPEFAIAETQSGKIVVTHVNPNANDLVRSLLNVEIRGINGIPVTGMPLTRTEQLIRSSTKLEMLIANPQCYTYKWIDVNNRNQVTSPPPSYLTRIDHHSYTNRWITLKTTERSETNTRKPLGLVIRGGSEYGLGIFVSRIEQNTAAAEAGLLISDQIINVNGHDFRNISHSKAVKVLRSYTTLRLLVRYIGKLPEPSVHSVENKGNVSEKNGILSTSSIQLKKYKKGCFAHESMKIDKLLKSLPDQYQKLIKEYRKGEICIDELMNLLVPSITQDKAYMFESIREMIRAIDKDRYDNYILRLEIGRLRRAAEVTKSCLSLRDSSTVHRNLRADRSQLYGKIPSTHIASCADINNAYRFNHFRTMGYGGGGENIKRINVTKLPYLSNAAKQYLKFYQEPQVVVVDKCRPFLGIAIEGSGNDGQSSIYCPFPRVVYLHPDGASSACSHIGLGCILLQVNGRSLEGLTHRQAARLIANAYRQSRPPWLEFMIAAPKFTMIN